MRIRPSRDKSFDAPIVPRPDGCFELDCWQEYLLEFDPYEDDGVPPSAVQRELDGEGRRTIVNFGDYVGHVRLGAIEVEVSSAKLRVDGFDRLLTAITDHISDLPFDFNTPTFVPMGRDGHESREILYQQFVYLRWAMSEEARPSLGDAWAQIVADPHRTLVRSERREHPWEARGISPRTLERIVSHPEHWIQLKPDCPAYETELAKSLRSPMGTRYVPEHVVELVAETCVDTPENRFAKYFVRRVADIAARAEVMIGEHSPDPHLVAQSRSIARSTQQMGNAHFLNDVSEMGLFPASSQVLQKRGPYQDLLRHHQALALSSHYPITSRDLAQLIESKSASTLYEYWCFFETAAAIRALGRHEHRPADAARDDLRADLERGLSLAYGDDVGLHFNRTFSRGREVWKSYSVTLRPDIVLKCRDDLHLLDAKFRIQTWGLSDESSEKEVDALETDDHSRQASPRWWKNADIHKMHAYRDALGSDGAKAKTVWVLYPGEKFVFYAENGSHITDVADFTPDMTGVGAIPLDPSGDSAALRTIISVLLL